MSSFQQDPEVSSAENLEEVHSFRQVLQSICFSRFKAEIDAMPRREIGSVKDSLYTSTWNKEHLRRFLEQTLSRISGGEDESVEGVKIDRAVGCLLGLAVADGLGHFFEFLPVRDTINYAEGPCFLAPSEDEPSGSFLKPLNRFGLKRGQWTDDTSMALCMADSLLSCGGYDGSSIRRWFWNWWINGVNNAFMHDTALAAGQRSVGLGGNIAMSIQETETQRAAMKPVPTKFIRAGCEDAGNGSLMRLAPIALRFHNNIEEARRMACESSLTTHPGEIAAEACAFFAHLLVRAIHRDTAAAETGIQDFLNAACGEYLAILEAAGIKSQARSYLRRLIVAEEADDSLERCWNWRSAQLELVRTLLTRGDSYNGYPVSPTYFGAYCLDGLAIALHAAYHTSSFDEAVVKCINFLGDADTTGAICAQLVGAFYGRRGINELWVQDVLRWDRNREIELRAVLLYQAAHISAF